VHVKHTQLHLDWLSCAGGLRNAWKLVSPQKSITVFANTEQQKSEWIEAIQAAIQSVVEHRKIWIQRKFMCIFILKPQNPLRHCGFADLIGLALKKFE
jgi:hypothetical protein